VIPTASVLLPALIVVFLSVLLDSVVASRDMTKAVSLHSVAHPGAC